MESTCICAAAIIGLACLLLLVPVMELQQQTASWSRTAARQQLALPAIGIGLVFSIAGLGLGLWLGRPLTRLIVRTFLPPRLRASLALLWTAEDLDPPVTHVDGTRSRSAGSFRLSPPSVTGEVR